MAGACPPPAGYAGRVRPPRAPWNNSTHRPGHPWRGVGCGHAPVPECYRQRTLRQRVTSSELSKVIKLFSGTARVRLQVCGPQTSGSPCCCPCASLALGRGQCRAAQLCLRVCLRALGRTRGRLGH